MHPEDHRRDVEIPAELAQASWYEARDMADYWTSESAASPGRSSTGWGRSAMRLPRMAQGRASAGACGVGVRHPSPPPVKTQSSKPAVQSGSVK